MTFQFAAERQQVLYEALRQRSQQLANMYLGAIEVLDTSSADRLAQAAHSMRELMEKIPEIVNVPMQAHREGLKTKVRDLERPWLDVLQNSQCHNGETWRGEMDAPLVRLLRKLEDFFTWFSNHVPRRREEVVDTLRGIDPSELRLPTILERRNVRLWDDLSGFFQSVAHHRRTPSNEEFRRYLEALEDFLLDRLRPRTFSDLDAIAELIREVEQNA